MPIANTSDSLILTLSCKDRTGIVAAVSSHLAKWGGFILDSQQYADLDSERFFLRIEFCLRDAASRSSAPQLEHQFARIGEEFSMDWRIRPSSWKPKLLVAVSRASHCLNDLLHRWRTGNLPVDVAGVVSNHENLRQLTEWHGIPFHHHPIAKGNKGEQEKALLATFDACGADYLVLARYMQILSPAAVAHLAGRCINIHHSFLPSFKGARPYHQAHSQGVKLIGATAHFVNDALDEGPIIEQDVERVDHRATEQELARIGRDIEARVLARAVLWTAERRVFLNGKRTIVFR